MQNKRCKEWRAEKKRQEEYEKFRTEAIAEMHVFMNQFDQLTDEEFQKHICHEMTPEQYRDGLILELYELKSMMLTNLRMVNEHMALQNARLEQYEQSQGGQT